MPIYEYECSECGKRIERLQRLDDPPPEACEHCGAGMRRLVSAPAIQFKGTGWYVTDYAGRKSSDDSGSEESSASDKPAGPESKKAESSKKKASSSSASSTSAKDD